ncbi:glycosyltransferase [Methanobrevibacter sp.]|uniref:glycosyltransferase family 2 protein n=1 Tax=Methanobrevibacter sp. TaxID=66852 RepID=UPI0025ED2E23|nr:glycosyltransferase [Methanobrevibacter sp.]MBR4448489.1 glycosyltransferase [Methanobrevibacter sp.]
MVRISVIIPVYNVEDYLEDTLNSLLNQTMISDIEVIMVDDGSTDDSRYIIDEYAKNFDNFHAYHKNNEGPGIARNYGLDFAKGEYVHFMDADDYLPPKAYETLYNFNPDADFIIGNLLKFGEYNIWENVLFKHAYKDFNANIDSFNFKEYPEILWDTITCNKLYKKSFLDKHNLRFINKNIYYEDVLFSFQSYVLADSIAFSRNIFYFWRSRLNKSSITQKPDDVKNFISRLEILRIYDLLMKKYALDETYSDIIYDKWLKHDLRSSLEKIGNYPGKYYIDLIMGTNYILKIIPNHLREDLNVYLKILYKMVENNDLKSLLYFAHLEDSIKQNPEMPLLLDEEYLKLIDINCNGEKQEFIARVIDVFNDNENLYLEFDYNIDFISNKCPCEMEAYLVYGNKQFPIKLFNNNTIILSLDLIKGLNHLKIRLDYKSPSFAKSSLLKNYQRKSIKYANFDIDLGIGINNILYLDVNRKTENNVLVKDVVFDEGNFILRCESIGEVKGMILTNFVTYKHLKCPVIYSNNSNDFVFIIPFDELKNVVVKKWELNCPQSLNSISIKKKFKFIYHNYEISFKNKRNKIYVSVDILNSKKQMEEILAKNEELINENNKLKNKNEKLLKTVDEFKSRRAVKLIDNVKNIFRR